MSFEEWLAQDGDDKISFDDWAKAQIWTKRFRAALGLKIIPFVNKFKIGRNEKCKCGSALS